MIFRILKGVEAALKYESVFVIHVSLFDYMNENYLRLGLCHNPCY